MKTGLIITGGKLDLAFAGKFLRGFAGYSGSGRHGSAEAEEDNGVRGKTAVCERRTGCADAAPGDRKCAALECREKKMSGFGERALPEDSENAESGTGGERRARGNYGFDCVILVDGGLEPAEKLGLVPDAIVGDFDTVRPEILDRYRRSAGGDTLWDVHKPEKDETDTELAIRTAMKLGCARLAILGATGGRLDHELSNIHLLKMCLDAGVEAALYDAQNRVSLLTGSRVFRRSEAYGKYVSFIPMTEQVKGITLTGFKYPLTGKNITIGREAGLCVSNEIVEETAAIRFDKGILICVESKD